MVLFLFLVMMLDVNLDSRRKQFRSYLPQGVIVGALVLFEMALVVMSSAIGGGEAPPLPSGSKTKALGAILYTDYVYPFEIAAVVLLVAVIAPIAFTHPKRKATRNHDPAFPAKNRPQKSVRILPVP